MLTTAGRAACTARTTYVIRREEISFALADSTACPTMPISTTPTWNTKARHAQIARDGHLRVRGLWVIGSRFERDAENGAGRDRGRLAGGRRGRKREYRARLRALLDIDDYMRNLN